MSEDEIAFADDATLRQWYCNAYRTAGKWAFLGGRTAMRWCRNNDVYCCTRYRVEMERRRVAVPNSFECYTKGIVSGQGAVGPLFPIPTQE